MFPPLVPGAYSLVYGKTPLGLGPFTSGIEPRTAVGACGDGFGHIVRFRETLKLLPR